MRLTDRAKKVLSYALEEAVSLSRKEIDTGLVFLSMLREPSGVAFHTLKHFFGFEYSTVKARVSEMSMAKGNGNGDSLPLFTQTAIRGISKAEQEARALGCDYIDTEHILLGLLADYRYTSIHLIMPDDRIIQNAIAHLRSPTKDTGKLALKIMKVLELYVDDIVQDEVFEKIQSVLDEKKIS